MMLFEKVPLQSLATFENERCRRRGPFDDDHAVLREILGRWFSGAPEKPSPSDLHAWLVADAPSAHQLAWCAEALVAASADPWFCLRALVREDAVSIHDLARVCAQAGCRHAALTTWLNHHADPTEETLRRLVPPAWAIKGLVLTKHGYYARPQLEHED